MTLTTDQISRVHQAIEETERFQAREARYMDHLQNKELLEFYVEHLAKLRGMLQPGPPAETPAPAVVDRNSTIAAIKANLKARGLRYSVTGGRGTAWGWIHIDLMPAVLKTTDYKSSSSLYRALGDAFGEKRGYDQISVPAGSDYYREYIDRSAGREPSVKGKPYWD